jgi:hypothetical protein
MKHQSEREREREKDFLTTKVKIMAMSTFPIAFKSPSVERY